MKMCHYIVVVPYPFQSGTIMLIFPEAVASATRITSYPWLNPFLKEVSTQIEVSTPQKMNAFILALSNHTLNSVSWKAESHLLIIMWSSYVGLISSIISASYVPLTQIGIFSNLSSLLIGKTLWSLINRSIPLVSRIAWV
jgi:hypothetical protein